jgi:hypothetical protein
MGFLPRKHSSELGQKMALNRDSKRHLVYSYEKEIKKDRYKDLLWSDTG